ncbi:hypothetical protein FHS43_005119 [Streptosporangium becharense]|uniref:Uncharacterized protein n=1 Tax=Streptosporangium becharense TaxID=1816182 RepID=A0A7W9ICH2_9ACTN|nr:hypothetical protein [Streptosporangium becharense]MBB5817891.1 hypothetical protein [Streptosporangium becharense]
MCRRNSPRRSGGTWRDDLVRACGPSLRAGAETDT